jgi:hypothetical protein
MSGYQVYRTSAIFFKVVVLSNFFDFLSFVVPFFFDATVFLLSFGLPTWAITYLYANLRPNVQSNEAASYPAWNVDDATAGSRARRR